MPKVHFFLNSIAMFVRSAFRSVRRRSSSNKFEVYDGGGKGSGRLAHPSLVQGAPFFCRMPPKIVGSYRSKDRGALELGRPKSNYLRAIHKQTAVSKQTAQLKERPLRTTRVFLAWSEPSHSDMGHLRSGMGLSSSNWVSQAQDKSKLARDCHFGPVMGHVKSRVGSFDAGIAFSQAGMGPPRHEKAPFCHVCPCSENGGPCICVP